MKKFTKILLVMICLGTIRNPLFSQAPTNGLIAYYPFTGNANDASGFGRNGVTYGGIALTNDRYGNNNQAYLFNGSNAGIAVNSWNTITGNTPRTMSIWFKTTNPSVSQQMLSWGTNSSSSSCYMGSGIYSGIKFFGFFGFANDLALVDAFQFYDNRWHLMTFTFDGSTMTLFFDGVAFMSRTGAALNTGSSRLTIGFHYTNIDYFNGSLDDIRIYNRALSVTEVQQTYLAEVASSTTTDIIKLGLDKFIHATGIGNTYVGLRTGAFSSGQNNTFLGFRVGSNSSGINNTFLGTDAGNKNTTGGFNTFTGSQAGFLTTTGTENTFNGYYSGYSNTTGSFNSLYGRNSGAYLTSGENNTFLGFSSGFSANGNKNVMIGRDAGAWATTGSENVFIGWASGTGIQANPNTGISNTFIGSTAGQFNTTGSNSTFIGFSSGNKNTTGIENTFIGTNSGFNNTTGSRNTINGYNSGANMLTGNDNVTMGWFAGNSITGSEVVAIGRGAGTWATTVSGSVFVGKDAGEGSSTASNTGVSNTFIGREAGNKNTSGSNNVFIGNKAGFSDVWNSTGSNNLYLGNLSGGFGVNGGTLQRSVAIGNNSKVSIDDAIILGDTANTNLKIGIGTTRPSKRLEVRAVNPNESGIRTSNLTSNSPTLSGNGKVLTVNNLGDIILVPDGGSNTVNTHSDSVWVRNGLNTRFSGTYIGIGTSNPQNRLDITALTSNSSGVRLNSLTSNSNTLSSNGKTLSVNSMGDIILVPDISGANTHSDSLWVRNGVNTRFLGGNLGIGITSPQSKLDVNGSINIAPGSSISAGGVALIRTTNPYNNNILLGSGSGLYLTNGFDNVFMGNQAGFLTSTGFTNTFIGTQSGVSNSSGSANLFVGAFSGNNNSIGGNNVFLGWGAGIGNISGLSNTNVGIASGSNIQVGKENIFFGGLSNSYGSNANSLERAGAIGYKARVSVNDAIVLGDFENTSLKVGIGMHDPQFKLDVKGPINIRGINGGLGELKFMTHNFLQGDKNFNSAIGFLSEVDSQYVHSTALGYKSYASANNVLVLGGKGENAVNVGIGNSAPQSSLEITSKNEGESGLMFTNLTQNFTAKYSNNKFLSVDEKGKVGLYNLSADQITLKLNSANQWSDKVFASNYQLMPIDKVENFIKTEGHLPNIPSAKDMTEKGVSTQEMFAKLLEKNEELMLYVLEQNKINSQQAKEIEELKKEVQKLKNK